MTPEEARQLLDGTTPAPWEANHECYTYDCSGYERKNSVVETLAVTSWAGEHCPSEVCSFEGHEGKFTGQGVDYTGEMGDMRKDAELVAAAPGIAAMIANMTTEYAVERNCSVIEGVSDWEKIGFGMYPGIIANTFWTTEKKLAEKLYKEAKTGHLPLRIVCRYVTEPQPLEGESQ